MLCNTASLPDLENGSQKKTACHLKGDGGRAHLPPQSLIPRVSSKVKQNKDVSRQVPWTIRRPNQIILKEISPEYLLEGQMLKLKLQYFGHLMQITNSFKKTLILGKIEGRRGRGRQRMRWLDGITDSMDMGQEGLACCNSWGCKESDTTE